MITTTAIIAAIGMGVVFFFLGGLVFCMTIGETVARRFGYDAEDLYRTVAAIAAARHSHAAGQTARPDIIAPSDQSR